MSIKQSLRVMVVDDMSTSRGLITMALDRLGIQQYWVENSGEPALKKLVTNPVHLVISDYNMPGMNGLQLLKALRENKPTSRIGFILITGRATPEIIDVGRRLGMNNMLEKPFDDAGFKRAIEAVVGRL